MRTRVHPRGGATKSSTSSKGSSGEDVAEMTAKERSIMKCVPSVIASTAATFGYRPRVLSFVLEAVGELAMPPGHFLCVAQVLDISGFWVACHDFRSQVVAATATLYMCVKLHDNPLERIGVDGRLLVLVAGAILCLELATNDSEPTLEEDVLREECRLLHAWSYELTTLTVAEWVEVLFNRTDIMKCAACTLLLRFAADAAREFAQVLLFQVQLSEEAPACGDQRMAVHAVGGAGDDF